MTFGSGSRNGTPSAWTGSVTRFPWHPDCQEEHPIHEPQPDLTRVEDEDLVCDVCGHPIDVVYVHSFELPIE